MVVFAPLLCIEGCDLAQVESDHGIAGETHVLQAQFTIALCEDCFRKPPADAVTVAFAANQRLRPNRTIRNTTLRPSDPSDANFPDADFWPVSWGFLSAYSASYV